MGQRATTESLAYRAAEYFGVHDLPRMSVRLSQPKGIAIVTRRPSGDRRPMLLLYREWPKVSGEAVVLTEHQRDELIEALRDA